MYFYKKDGKQCMDLRGCLILTHNRDLVRARTKNNAPRRVKNGKWIEDIPNLKFFRKVRATFKAIGFIWGKSQAMDPLNINEEVGLK